MLGTLLSGVLLLGGTFWIFLREAGTGKIPVVREDLAWVAFPVMAVMMVFFAVKILDRRPALELSDEGLLAREIASDVIPWSAIRSVSIRTFKRNRFLELQIDPEVVRKRRPNTLNSKMRFLNRALGFSGYTIMASMLDHDADFLLQLINSHLPKTTM